MLCRKKMYSWLQSLVCACARARVCVCVYGERFDPLTDFLDDKHVLPRLSMYPCCCHGDDMWISHAFATPCQALPRPFPSDLFPLSLSLRNHPTHSHPPPSLWSLVVVLGTEGGGAGSPRGTYTEFTPRLLSHSRS